MRNSKGQFITGGFTGKHTEASKIKMRESHLGQKVWNKGVTGYSTSKKGTKVSDETRKKMTIANRKIASKNSGENHYLYGKSIFKGEKNYNWKGGITKINRSDRVKLQRLIQKKVLSRDNYTCQMCFNKGGILHVDHIIPFADYLDGRFDVNNCRTLCRECHYLVTFKSKMPKDSQWGKVFMKEVN